MPLKKAIDYCKEDRRYTQRHDQDLLLDFHEYLTFVVAIYVNEM
jgi:hypothetical protein